MSRHKADIDAKAVEAMAFVGSTNQEIADYFNVSERTIRRRFAEILTKRKAGQKIKLREMLWQSAQGGNIAAIIFLSKNLLNMSDKLDTKNETQLTTESLDDASLIDRGKGILSGSGSQVGRTVLGVQGPPVPDTVPENKE